MITRRERGIALVAVLWVIALLAIVAASFSTETRTVVRQTSNSVGSAKAEALSTTGISVAIQQLVSSDGSNSVNLRGAGYTLELDGGLVHISVEDEGGKLDLNEGKDVLFQGVFMSLGLADQEADALVDALNDFRDEDDFRRLNGAEHEDYEAAGVSWRPKNSPFETVEEVLQILGMTQDLYERLSPVLTVHSRNPRINLLTTPRQLLLSIPEIDSALVETFLIARDDLDSLDHAHDLPALPEAWNYFEAVPPGPVYMIRSEAQTSAGSIFVRDAIVELTDNFTDYEVKGWRRGGRVLSGDAADR